MPFFSSLLVCGCLHFLQIMSCLWETVFRADIARRKPSGQELHPQFLAFVLLVASLLQVRCSDQRFRISHTFGVGWGSRQEDHFRLFRPTERADTRRTPSLMPSMTPMY